MVKYFRTAEHQSVYRRRNLSLPLITVPHLTSFHHISHRINYLPKHPLDVRNKMKPPHPIPKQHTRVVPIRARTHPLRQRPLILLALIILLNRAHIAILLIHAIARIAPTCAANKLAEMARPYATPAVADRKRVVEVEREARCEWRVERACARAGAGVGVEAETGFDGAAVAACGGRGHSAAAEAAHVVESCARAALLHEGDGFVVEAVGASWACRWRAGTFGEGYGDGVFGDWGAGVLLDEHGAGDLAKGTREVDR